MKGSSMLDDSDIARSPCLLATDYQHCLRILLYQMNTDCGAALVV